MSNVQDGAPAQRHTIGGFLSAIGTDLKGSWYFRIWLLFAIALTIAGLVGLGEISSASTAEASGTNSYATYFWNAPEINFPNFRFRTISGMPIANLVCATRHGFLVPTGHCEGWSTNNQTCRAIYGADAPPAFFARGGSNRIVCNFTVPGQVANEDLVAWEMDALPGVNDAIGPNAGASIWIPPFQYPGVWVLLSKILINNGTSTTEHWERSMLFHSSVGGGTDYCIETVINTNQVTEYVVQSWWNSISANSPSSGWYRFGALGGMIMMMAILHHIIMFVVGFFISNDSVLLGAGKSQYQQLA